MSKYKVVARHKSGVVLHEWFYTYLGAAQNKLDEMAALVKPENKQYIVIEDVVK